MRCSVCYDIADDKRRRKIVKILLAYTCRVQESVFEGILSKDSFEEMKSRLANAIDPAEDSVRMYFVCDDCGKKIGIIGIGERVENVRYVIL